MTGWILDDSLTVCIKRARGTSHHSCRK